MKQIRLKNLKEQAGVSKFGLLMMFVLLVSFLTFGLKVVPLYVDHNLISGVCEELIENGEAANMTITQIRQRVSNTLRINNVTDFDLSSITLRKENDQAIITIDYERRVELAANLDVVAKFNTVLQ
ncbi:MAG: DUF4845 domain-containing protein [Proteobacteria bacterium]|jgi:hypothetical protein|nr:DUF4845 domain-containing protein [Pseudomonadota bacterium]MDA1291704.1 DUF4845 domain-containing protein [Pseudomonadota bacterium]